MFTLPFSFDIEKINTFKVGDIGIADNIHESQFKPIINTIPYPDDKALYIKSIEPKKNEGMWALEKCFVSTSIAVANPHIELSKILLELMAYLEYVNTALNTGLNPYNLPTSFFKAYNDTKILYKNIITEFEANDEIINETNPILPPLIFLGEYKRKNTYGNVYSITTAPKNDEFWLNENWPQYTERNEFLTERKEYVKSIITELPNILKQRIIQSVDGIYINIWNDMQSNNQLTLNHLEKFNLIPINIIKYYQPLTVEYLNEQVYIDIENDYNVVVIKTEIEVTTTNSLGIKSTEIHEEFYITAELKNSNSTYIYNPIEFESVNTNYAYNTYYNKILPLIITKLIPTVYKIKLFTDDINNNLGKIIVEQMKIHYKMFDITLKDLPEDNEERSKFWSGDKFVMDGYASISAGDISITIDIVDGIPTYYAGIVNFPNKKENQTLKHIINMCILPGNYLIKYVEYMDSLIDKLIPRENMATNNSTPLSLILTNTYDELLSFDWATNMLTFKPFIKYLGATNDNILTIPYFSKGGIGPGGAANSAAFLKINGYFFNGFIDIHRAILNTDKIKYLNF